ncbi:hypothetical protein FRX31_024716 [Thalictrum thalictroides]|uniref:Uncharacterized protein n=1 Tax=Thalictrum thalictroides TaxID=46969 RepID=A0A7J6VLT9_THATH|nr:hypothetical protein FRX31_024716 [Thalictrum thalictroides]
MHQGTQIQGNKSRSTQQTGERSAEPQANKESQAEKQVQNASKGPQPQQQGQNTLQAPLKTRHERVPGGVGAYASDTGLAFIRLPGMKKGYWYKPGDCVGAPNNNQVMEALDGPPTTQPSQFMDGVYL